MCGCDCGRLEFKLQLVRLSPFELGTCSSMNSNKNVPLLSVAPVVFQISVTEYGDGAVARTARFGIHNTSRAGESGVASDLPPQSKNVWLLMAMVQPAAYSARCTVAMSSHTFLDCGGKSDATPLSPARDVL